MKTQCPNCKNVFTLPDEYKDKPVKCTRCKKDFVPEKFKKPPIVVSSQLPSKSNFVTRIWTKSPVAFRVGFLATLGVLSALFFAYYFMEGLGKIRFFSLYPAKQRQAKPSSQRKPLPIDERSLQRERQAWANAETKLTPENVCALIQLFRHSRELEIIQDVTRSLSKNIIKNPTTFKVKVMLEVFAIMSYRLETNAKELSRLKLPRNPQIANPSFEQVQNAYINAMYAEIDAINGLIHGLETSKFGSNWQQVLDKTVNLGTEASIQLIILMSEIDENLVKVFSESKK